jgi:hypothetical protein
MPETPPGDLRTGKMAVPPYLQKYNE